MSTLPPELENMKRALASLPRDQCSAMTPHFLVLVEVHEHRQSILTRVNEVLSQLRVDMKYLLFDNQCLSRELEAARKGNQ